MQEEPDVRPAAVLHHVYVHADWSSCSPVALPAAEVPMVLWLCAGDRYVVVDCGGGTVDLTVHQIRLPEGHLKELYKASGGRTSNALFLLDVSSLSRSKRVLLHLLRRSLRFSGDRLRV